MPENFTWWSALGPIVGFLGSVIIGVVGFLIKSWLKAFQENQIIREDKLSGQIKTLIDDIKRVETAQKYEAVNTSKAFQALPETYVPRRELEATIQRLESIYTNTQIHLKSIDGQVHRLTELLFTASKKES